MKTDSLVIQKNVEKPNFIHPMSHEVDFMNLHKFFTPDTETSIYTQKTFQPDYLSLFLYEIKTANLKFKHVENVKFLFLQIENWYFEVSEIERNDMNSGWLISNLIKIDEKQKADLLQKFQNE